MSTSPSSSRLRPLARARSHRAGATVRRLELGRGYRRPPAEVGRYRRCRRSPSVRAAESRWWPRRPHDRCLGQWLERSPTLGPTSSIVKTPGVRRSPSFLHEPRVSCPASHGGRASGPYHASAIGVDACLGDTPPRAGPFGVAMLVNDPPLGARPGSARPDPTRPAGGVVSHLPQGPRPSDGLAATLRPRARLCARAGGSAPQPGSRLQPVLGRHLLATGQPSRGDRSLRRSLASARRRDRRQRGATWRPPTTRPSGSVCAGDEATLGAGSCAADRGSRRPSRSRIYGVLATAT